MSREVTGILHELEGILEKRATAAMSKNVHQDKPLEGDPTDTKGEGTKSPIEQDNKSPRDHALQEDLPMKTQLDDGQKSVAYNHGMGNSGANETKSVDGFNSGNPDKDIEKEYAKHDSGAQTSKMANDILRGLNSLLNGRNGVSYKSAGGQAVDRALLRLLHKSAMSAEEVADKWPSMSEEEKEAMRAEMPELVEKAMALMNKAEPAGDEGGEEDYAEKMSAAQWAEYQHYKQAGAQAAVQFLGQLQQQDPQYQIQKEAAARDYQHSKMMGRMAAERDIASARTEYLLQKQAGYDAAMAAQVQPEQVKAASAYQHPASQNPQEAYEQMLKQARDAGINPDVLHSLLTDMHRQAALEGGTPRPFVDRGHVKSAVDVAPLYPVLTGLLDEGTISSEEKEAILNYLAGVEDLSEDALRTAVQDLKAPEPVLKRILAGDIQQHQRNTHKADSPEPAMPATQPSPSAESAEETRTVSEGGEHAQIPGSVEASGPNEDMLEQMIVEAALRNALKRCDPTKYRTL
jgi:hypothetical protein